MIQPGTCALRVRGPARYFGGEYQAAAALSNRAPAPRPAVAHADHCRGSEWQTPRSRPSRPPGSAPRQSRSTIVPTGRRPRFVARSTGERARSARARRAPTPTRPAHARRLRRARQPRCPPTGSDPWEPMLTGLPAAETSVHWHRGRPPPELTRWIELDDPLDRVDQVAFAVRRASEDFVCRPRCRRSGLHDRPHPRGVRGRPRGGAVLAPSRLVRRGRPDRPAPLATPGRRRHEHRAALARDQGLSRTRGGRPDRCPCRWAVGQWAGREGPTSPDPSAESAGTRRGRLGSRRRWPQSSGSSQPCALG